MLAPSLFRENLFDDLFDGFDTMDREMERLNHRLYGKRANREMLMDVKEQEDHYEVEIDLPGFKKEDIKAELSNGYLTITATKDHDQKKEDKEGRIIRQERWYGTMSRSFYVGEELKTEDIQGRYEGGVLTLNIPKMEKPNQVEHSSQIMIEG